MSRPNSMDAILNGPAGEPPAGKQSNLTNPPNMYDAGLVVIVLGASIPTLFVAVRLYTKIFLIRKLLPSDCLMALAWALSIAVAIPGTQLNKAGPGIDQWNLRVKDFISMLHWFWRLAIIYGFAFCLAKVTLLVQVLEMFSTRRDAFYWICHGIMAMICTFYVIITFVQSFACRPVHSFWDILDPERKCLDTAAINVGSSLFNALSDIAILVLPQPRIWKLNTSRFRRSIVAGVFLMGFLACASSVLRLIYAVQAYTKPNNVAYYTYMTAIWCIPELAASVSVGCLPTLPRFIKHLWQQWRNIRGMAPLNRSSGASHTPHRYESYGQPATPGLSSSSTGSRGLKPRQLEKTLPTSDLYPLTSYASHSEPRDSESPFGV